MAHNQPALEGIFRLTRNSSREIETLRAEDDVRVPVYVNESGVGEEGQRVLQARGPAALVPEHEQGTLETRGLDLPSEPPWLDPGVYQVRGVKLLISDVN